jgi:hypothetical protein
MIQGAGRCCGICTPAAQIFQGDQGIGRLSRVEIWPQYSAKAVFYVAQLSVAARLLTI